MKKIEITKKKVVIAAVAVVLLVAAVYFLMPRSLGNIANVPDEVNSIEIVNFQGGYTSTSEVLLTLEGRDAKDFLDIINNTKVYKSPVYTKMSDGGAVRISKNITLNVPDGTDIPSSIYVFTDDILMVNGIQYRIYGGAFIDSFLSLIS